MRRKAVFLFLLMCTLPLCAQWDIVDEVFIPPVYYVGDSVILQFRLTWEDEKELAPPSELPESEWLEIESVQVSQEGYEAQVTVRFRSYMTGTRSLPALDLGGITLDSLKIFTSSLVEQDGVSELRGIRNNQDFPGIRLLIPLFLLGLVSFPYILFLFLRYLAGRIRLVVRWLYSSGPRRKMKRLIKKLESRVDESGRERAFYIDISSGVRSYLADRTETDFLSMTTRDMKALASPPVDRILWKDLTDLLQTADMVKFAGERISRKEKVESLAVLNRFMDTLEKEDMSADL